MVMSKVKVKVMNTIVNDVSIILAKPVPLSDGPLICLSAQGLVPNSP